MKILFIHQNFPGQFKHLAAHFAAKRKNRVVFVTKRKAGEIPGVRKVLYALHREPVRSTHPYIRGLESGVLYGQAVARVALDLKNKGFVPDIVVAHPAWGEALFIKDVFPDSPLLDYFEFFYGADGADVGFDPDELVTLDDRARTRVKNAIQLLSLEACDWGLSPTRWQWQQYSAQYRSQISVIHDGIDTRAVTPRPDIRIRLARGGSLSRDDEVITYVARNLEPYRGFHIFMRALEEITRRRPQAHVLIVGGDAVSYGRRLPDGQTYRAKLLSEVRVDLDRVHFLGRVPYAQFLKVLQVSSAHVYLTYPFVLSWSMLEAMAAGCLVIGSATPPVQEVIEDGQNGLLVDFFSPRGIADRVDEVLDHEDRMAEIRKRARQTILQQYDLRTVCLARQIRLLKDLAVGRKPRPDVVDKPSPSQGQGRRARASQSGPGPRA